MNRIIEIPFGAKDSELKGWEYDIPEGMEAVIENGKVIVREKESDDERIRRCIGLALTDVDEQRFANFGVTLKDCLAYIEKQKENSKLEDCWRKVSDSFRDSTREVICKDAIGNFFIGRYYKGSNSWEVSVYDDADKSNEDNPPVVMWCDIPSEKQKEQKPAEWSEQDKEMLTRVEQIVLKHWNSLSDSFYHKYDDENQDAESCYNWIKSLLERFNLHSQPHTVSIDATKFDNLDEAAEEYTLDIKAKPFSNLVKEAFKAGAEWIRLKAHISLTEDSDADKKHLEPIEEQKYDGNMDKECIKLCDVLNSIPSIDTFESCCGHLKDRYSIWFFCNDIITVSRLARCVERNYSDGKWELLVDSTDTHPSGVFWLRSKMPFQSYDEMEKSINELCSNIQHWFNPTFDSYFNSLVEVEQEEYKKPSDEQKTEQSEDERMWDKILNHFDWSFKGPYLTHEECDEIKTFLVEKLGQKPAEHISDSALQKIKKAIKDYKKQSEHYKDREENFYQYYGGKADGLQLALIYFGYENE